MKIFFDDDNTNKGVEGWYEIINSKLIVYLKATNSREDWISNFCAWPKYSSNLFSYVHNGYYNYAIWTINFIRSISMDNNIALKNVILFGYSMGGGIAQIVALDLPISIVSIDGPRTTSKVKCNMKLVFNHGSLIHNIPFWFSRIKNYKVLNEKWKPFWESHADYSIDEIIKEEIK